MYNYEDAMKEDVRDYLEDNEYFLSGYTRDELEDKLNEDLWTEDSVTGNGSGSYTFSNADAKKYVTEDGADYLREAAKEFSCEHDVLEHFMDGDYEYFDYEYLDVTIRCYLLGQIIHEVLDEDFKEEGDI